MLEINDVVRKQDARPLIEIKSSPMMVGKWLFDTGAGLTCMSSQQFRLIPIENRPKKLNIKSQPKGSKRSIWDNPNPRWRLPVSNGMEWENSYAGSNSVQEFVFTPDFGN